MGYRVIETDDKVWVAGVNWLTFATRPPAKDLIELAKESKSGLVAMRNAGAFQVGFCQLEKLPKVKKKQVLCLGPAVSMSRAVPWRGIFDLGDGQWWYVAVRDNFMLTIDGDVVGDRALIDSIAESHAFYGDWDEYEGTLEDALESASMQDAPQVSLSSAKSGPARVIAMVAVGAMVVAAAAYGGFLFSEHMRLLEVQRKAAAARARQLALAKLRTEVKAKKPVSLAVDPGQFLQVCSENMLRAPLVQRGWELKSMTCEPGSLQLTWKKHKGADPSFEHSAGAGVFNQATQELVVNESLANSVNIVIQDDPARAKSQWHVLQHRMTGLGMSSQGPGHDYTLLAAGPQESAAKNSSKPPVVSKPAANNAKKAGASATSSPAKPIEFSAGGMLPPSVASTLFTGLGGLSLTKMHWTEQGGWSYAGELR